MTRKAKIVLILVGMFCVIVGFGVRNLVRMRSSAVRNAAIDNIRQIEASGAIDSSSMATKQRATTLHLASIAELSNHVGEYPCSNGLLKAPALISELKATLARDFEAYAEHMSLSGCGAIERRGDYLLMDLSQLHVGGYDSMIVVRPSDAQLYLFWLRSGVRDKDYRVYGRLPLPEEVKSIVADEMNQRWGHVARFTWSGDAFQIEMHDK